MKDNPPLVPCTVQGQGSNPAGREIPFSAEDVTPCIPQKDLETESSLGHHDSKESLETACVPNSVFVLSDSQEKAKSPLRDSQHSMIKAHQFLSLILKHSVGSIKFLCLLTTPSPGLLIPHHLNRVRNLSSPWLQRGAHRRTIERHLQGSSRLGDLVGPPFPGFLLDLHKEKKTKSWFLSSLFLEVACFSSAAECHLEGHYEFAEQRKTPLGGMKEHMEDGGNLQFLKAPLVSNRLVFLKGRERWCSCGS